MTTAEPAKLVHSKAPPHASVRVKEALTPPQMLEFCARLHTKDKAAEGRKGFLKAVGVIAMFATVPLFIIGGQSGLIEIVVVACVSMAISVLSFILVPVLGAGDVDDRKLAVVQRLVEVLHLEMHQKRPVELELDFRGYMKSKPLSDTTRWFNATGVKVYERAWGRIRFTLRDGSSVALAMKTTCKRKQKAKRKYTKIRDSLKEDVAVIVTPPKNARMNPEAASRARRVLGAMRGAVQTKFVVDERRMVASFCFGPGSRFNARSGWGAPQLDRLLDGQSGLMLVLLSVRAMRAALVR